MEGQASVTVARTCCRYHLTARTATVPLAIYLPLHLPALLPSLLVAHCLPSPPGNARCTVYPPASLSPLTLPPHLGYTPARRCASVAARSKPAFTAPTKSSYFSRLFRYNAATHSYRFPSPRTAWRNSV